MPSRLPGTDPLLAIDSGSPLLSVAVGWADRTLAVRQSPSSRSSAELMRLLDDCVRASGTELTSLAGVLVLSGPGSFTGLRVGMSVALGLHQAVGLAAGTVPTFLALARRISEPQQPAIVLVRALRDEWYAQQFARQDDAPAPPERLTTAQLLDHETTQMVGFDLEQLAEQARPEAALSCISPGPLAEVALTLAEAADWSSTALCAPNYQAPPPVRQRPQPIGEAD